MNVLKSLAHPDELLALVKFKTVGCKALKPGSTKVVDDPQTRRCYELLNMTSRSFAAVIQSLDDQLRHAVCIFYLVLRALDTVEDDMSIAIKKKKEMLQSFHCNLQDPDWCFMESTESDKLVLEEFPIISSEFRRLKPCYQEVIDDICQRMGNGMCEYLEKCPDSLEEWDQYCHYVAGLVGIGLSKLFEASGLEDKGIGQDVNLANSMGLFLQKTNIIRDYLEDTLENRCFWPKQVWGKYCSDLRRLRNEDMGKRLACLNELVNNALHHIPDCITYLSKLSNQSVFNFCAIPQVMAIATLQRCYDNPAVYEQNVKIRKGEAVKMMIDSDNIDKVKAIFTCFLLKIRNSTSSKNPEILRSVNRALKVCETRETYTTTSAYFTGYISCGLILGALVWQYWSDSSNVFSYLAAGSSN